MVEKMISELLKEGLKIIEKREFNNPSLDVQLILMHILNKDKLYLLTHLDKKVSTKDQELFLDMVNRRNTGYPLQYMINKQEFMGLDFYVEEGVLIPRPDTETLVETVIEYMNNNGASEEKSGIGVPMILDIGTGSGAIAISLAHYIENSSVTAIDINPIAIEVARKNADTLNVRNVNVIHGDLFGDMNLQAGLKFDLIVSNPPYIETSTIDKLQTEVSVYEPKLALDGGENGLVFYEKIAEIAEHILAEKGILCVEIGYNQADTVCDIFNKTNFFDRIKVIKDLSQNDRVVIAFRE